MKLSILTLTAIVLLLSVSVFAQTTQPTPPPVEDDVVKISTNLIQLDVVVTDKNGKQVTDLKPEDFEIYENGKKQDVSNFSYILANGANKPADTPTAEQSPKEKNKYAIPAPSAKLRLEQVRRTYAIVVDDLGLSFDSTYFVQKALRKFINEQMQDGDLVAIIKTGVGIGALQSFTSDKRQLLAAVDKVKWNPQGRAGINTFEPISPNFEDEINGGIDYQGKVKTVAGTQESAAAQGRADQFRNESFAVGTLGALSYIIRGLRELPGRKSLMLISEGFSSFSFDVSGRATPNRIVDSMRTLADLANRSSVVIYTIDPRGLRAEGMALAQDDITSTFPGSAGSNSREQRADKFIDSQQSLRYLAYETGGIPFVNQNGINYGLNKVTEDQNGYYLMGYQPDAETFDPKRAKFNNITIKVTRPDFKVRYRSGFFGITDKEIRQIPQNPRQKLTAALVSPFGADEINLSLYSIFYNDDRDRSFIRSFVYIDPKELTFKLDNEGFYHTEFNIVAAVYNSDGASANNKINSQTLKFTKEQFARVQRNGIIYNLPVPIIKPDAYQFRIALQDTATGKIGAASQFIEIPDLSKKKLTLSNLVVKQYSLDEWKKISLGQNDNTNAPDNSALLDTVVRKFKRGSVFTYAFIIYNAKSAAGQKPQLQMQVRLFREGKPVVEGAPSPINSSDQKDSSRIEVSNAITLGTDLSPGDYALQIVITDKLAKEKNQLAAQSIDFEIVQ